MGVEVVGSEMAQVETITELEKSFLHEKENAKLDWDDDHNEPIKFGSQVEVPVQGEENNASDANFPKDAVDDWTVPRRIDSFFFIRYRNFDDPKIKVKYEEIEKLNQARFRIIEDIKAEKKERAEVLSQLKSLRADFDQYQTVVEEKRKEMGPLQQALGKLRTNSAGGRGGLCSSEEELNDLIYSLKYRMQHESIPLAEEKQILREIKQLEGTREKVIANVAMRAKIQDSLGRKEAIQDQVKLMGANLDEVRKEQQALKAKRTKLRDKAGAYETKIDSLQDELDAVTEKRDKVFQTIQDLKKQRDEQNISLYQSRSLLNKAREIAATKDISALKELSNAELEKFMALWNGSKTFRDDYEKRILQSLDNRQLSRDGRIRNPDEKPLVELEVERVAKPIVKHQKEDNKPIQEDVKHDKKAQKDAGKKGKDSKSSVEHDEVEDSDKKAQKDAGKKGNNSKSSDHDKVEDIEIPGSDKLQKEPSADKVLDEAKLKEMKREEEITKAKQAMERKKKLAEKAAAKAAIRAQKEAEKKIKERDKKAKKKAASSGPTANPDEEASEPAADASEAEKVEENTEAPVSDPAAVKEKIQKEIASIRHRSRAKGPDALPRAILKRKKATNYWMWAAPAAFVLLLLLVFGYNYLL